MKVTKYGYAGFHLRHMDRHKFRIIDWMEVSA